MSCRETPSHQRWTTRPGRESTLSVFSWPGGFKNTENTSNVASWLLLLRLHAPTLCAATCRFLLVGQSMPASLDDDVIRDGEALSSRPFRNAGRTGRQLSLCGTPEKSTYRQMSLSERSSIRVEEIIPAARVAIQVFQ